MEPVIIKIGGENRALQFDVGMLKLLKVVSKKDPLEGREDVDAFDEAAHIVYAGMQREHKLRKAEFTYTLDQVNDWIESMHPREVMQIFSTFRVHTSIEPSEVISSDEKK